jgi:hypothetical protein
MKRHRVPVTMSFITVMIILLPASVFGQSSISGVTGAGAGTFPGSTTFSGVSVSGLQFGMGVFTPGTTATGQFQVTLLGTTALGQPQNIEIGGDAASGAINVDGSRTFSGTATVDMGDGTPPLTGVAYTVRATANTLLVTVGLNNLPVASLTGGSITID